MTHRPNRHDRAARRDTLVVTATAVAATLTAPVAAAEGVTSTKLADAGWTCFSSPR